MENRSDARPCDWTFTIHEDPKGVRLQFDSSEDAGGDVIFSQEEARAFILDVSDKAGLPAPRR